jgi:hypothetical protein
MKKNAKSALKWSFHSPDLGVSMVRIIQLKGMVGHFG